MAFYALVSWDSGGRVTKYAVFRTAQEAADHVAEYGGISGEATIPIGDIVVVNDQITDGGPRERPVPQLVSRYQFKKAVLNSGQLAALKAQYPSLTDEAKLYWDDAPNIEIDSPLILELKALMGLTDRQVENFFRKASEL